MSSYVVNIKVEAEISVTVEDCDGPQRAIDIAADSVHSKMGNRIYDFDVDRFEISGAKCDEVEVVKELE